MFALNNQRQISAEFKEQASQQIHELLNMVSGVDFVMLSSADGFELALASKKNLDNRGKIAAVSSSILAMVSAFIAEIHLSGCKTIKLTKTTKHAKRHFWLNDICTCHGLLPSHSA